MLDKAFAHIGKGMVLFLFAAPVGFLTAMFTAWPIMLALGVIHHDITRFCPALGYWATVLIIWGLSRLMYRRPANV